MKRCLLLLLLLFNFLFNNWEDTFAQDKSSKIESLLQQYYENGMFNGSALVSENGEVIFKKGYGYANFEWDIKNTPDTKFRIGSITKTFTAMLIMQLVEEGKLNLDDSISDHLPEYKNISGNKITIRHLLTHSSGLPNYTENPDYFLKISQWQRKEQT